MEYLELTLLREYTQKGYAEGSQTFLASPYADMAYEMFTFAGMFVLWHEYAHYLKGHIESSAIYAPLAGIPGVFYMAGSLDLAHEYEADSTSFGLVEKCAEEWKSDRARLIGSIGLVFQAIQHFHGEKGSPSHPPPKDRVQKLFGEYLTPDEQLLRKQIVDAF